MNLRNVAGIFAAIILAFNMTACGPENGDNVTSESQQVQNFSDDINTDILSRHLLPSLERMEENDRKEFVESLQVYKKAQGLGLTDNDLIYPEKNLASLLDIIDSIPKGVPSDAKNIDFSGTTSKELQKAINNNAGKVINIKSDKILINSQINLRSDTYIMGNNVLLTGKAAEYMLVADGVENVVLDSVKMEGGADYGIFLADSENIVIQNCEINGLGQKPVCITGESKRFRINSCRFENNGAGGIYCTGNVSEGIIEKNIIGNNSGTSNWMAGIVFTSIDSGNSLDIWETFGADHHFPAKENLYSQTKCPHSVLATENTVIDNNASGIYSDGAYSCYIINNTVQNNDKEGICLDYGTIGFYLKNNLFSGNGRRIRQTDDDLRMDFVLDAGRMEDGSAKSKLPGISIDNAAYNILENNTVLNNYGGGIKMVRTGIRNLIIENIVKDNNEGQNDTFHFFGIELGSAIADTEATDMDFTPDFENIVCRNIISGDHYSGVFIGEDCYVNDIFDNVIMEPQMFSVEAISVKFNSIINNFSNKDVRNEYSE